MGSQEVINDLAEIKLFARDQLADVIVAYGHNPEVLRTVLIALTDVVITRSYQAGSLRIAKSIGVKP